MENKLQQLLEEAHALVKRVSVNEIISIHDEYCIIDVREPDEVAQSGKVKNEIGRAHV